MIKTILDSSKIKKSDLFRWADFIELSCLFDIDGEAPLEETLRESWGYETGLGGYYVTNGENIEYAIEEDRAVFEDKFRTNIIDVMRHLQFRSRILGESYPFELIDHDLVLRRKETIEVHRLYCYILHSANLPFHTSSHRDSLTKGFERLAYHALEELVPPTSIVAMFGTAANDQYKSYTGNKFNKLCCFANEMGTCIDHYNIKEETYPSNDTGDGGLDVASWYPFNDNASHFPLILAQAGCTSDEKTMLSKQHEVNANTWKQRIKNIWPISMMITPMCYRLGNGNFIKPSDIITIFIDRIRLMLLLSSRIGDFSEENLPLYNDMM